jgi:hypothetical protein
MQDMQPDNTMNTLPNGEVDREGAMAKADLYKLANYSLKLFKKVQDEDQMEAWVQAKITKAADYIASVYHYLEYEMKFSEYGDHLSNAEVYNESMSPELRNKLMEAKEKIKELKKLQADKQSGKEKKVEEGILSGGEETCKECGGSGTIYREATPVPDHVKSKVEKYKRLTKATHAANKRLDRNNNGIPDDEEQKESFGDADNKEMKVGDTKKTRTGELTKTSTGVVHKNTSYKDEGDEIASNAKSGKGIKSHAKAQSAAEKKEKAPAQKMSPKSAKTWGMKDSEKFDNRDGAPAKPKKEKEVDETYGQGIYAEGKGKKPDFLDMDKDGDKKEPMKKAVADKKKNPFAKKTNEALKGGQKKLDVDGDGDIEADDLADLRAKKEKKVDESTAWKNKAQAVKESLDSMTTAGGTQEDLTKAAMGLATYAAKIDPKGFEAAMEAGDEAFTKYLQDMLAKGDVQPNPQAVQQAMDQVQGGGETSPEDQPKDMAGAGDIEAGEGVVTDFAAGAANQLGKEVGNVVRAGKTIAQNVSQFGSDVAGAAKAGYNQATGANNINSVKTGRQAPDPLQTPSAEPQTHNSAMAPKVGVPTGLRESSELDRMKEFLTRLNG